MNLVILADVWHSMPFIALILQAALATLPAELEEAAAVDGANAWQRFTKSACRCCVRRSWWRWSSARWKHFASLISSMSSLPVARPMARSTISYLTYLETFSFGHVGRGAALSFLISAFTLAMAIIYIRFLYRPEDRAHMKRSLQPPCCSSWSPSRCCFSSICRSSIWCSRRSPPGPKSAQYRSTGSRRIRL